VSFFSASKNILTSTLLEVVSAVALSVGISPFFVSARRVRDVTYPLTPSVLWINPRFAGDIFPLRRLQGSGVYVGVLSFDIQINVINNAMASSLQATLSSNKAKVAADIMKSLEIQGSLLSKSTISVKVQPYVPVDGSKTLPIVNDTDHLVPIIAGVTIFFTVIILVLTYKLKKSMSSITPLNSEQNKESSNKNNWSSSTRDDFLRESKKSAEVVAKVQAEHENDKANVSDSIESFKADHEASLQERIAQREVVKARLARQKAEELKLLRLK